MEANQGKAAPRSLSGIEAENKFPNSVDEFWPLV
jgi:hypothetical protein